MFCSNCGKTLEAGQANCPHCGVAVGGSLMSGHTSVQPKYQPVEQGGGQARYTPYTKTTYTSMENTGDDVYSRTAYRPILTDAETPAAPSAPEADIPSPENDSKTDTAPKLPIDPDDPSLVLPKAQGEGTELQKETLKRLTEIPEDAPAPEEAERIVGKELNIRVQPPKPIRKTGISPEVENYIQRMEAAKGKTRRRRDLEPETTEDINSAAANPEAEPEAEDEKPARKKRERAPKEKKPRGKAARLAARVLAVVAIVALVGAGLVYLAFKTQPKSPITGVSLDLYTKGVALMKTRSTDEYRKGIITLFNQDQTGASALAQQAEDSAEISALLPEKPQENDAKFIETLLSIQKSIDTATMTDALALMTANDPSLSSLSDESKDQWDIINNAILRLETADSMTQLKAISEGVVIDTSPKVQETPEPETTAYTTLNKGMTKNKAVKTMQVRLYQLGWLTGARDGNYGSITQSAVKRFQQAAGLEVTGIATPEVQEAIFSDTAPRSAAKATPAPDIDAAALGDEFENDVTDQANAGS